MAFQGPLRQALAVPFRDREGRREFCLITSLRGNWIFPKGIIDPGETPEVAALKEAREEAGLHGRIVGSMLGQYDDRKWGTDLVVAGYLMQATKADDVWLEAGCRRRRWCSADEARSLLENKSARRLLEIACQRLAAGVVNLAAELPVAEFSRC